MDLKFRGGSNVREADIGRIEGLAKASEAGAGRASCRHELLDLDVCRKSARPQVPEA